MEHKETTPTKPDGTKGAVVPLPPTPKPTPPKETKK